MFSRASQKTSPHASNPAPERKKGPKMMQSSFLRKKISRPEMFGNSTGSAADLLAAKRAQFNAAPLETERLHEALTMLSGPGGTLVILNGPDGKIIVDTFVRPAWPRLKKSLDGLGNEPVKWVINTHWHIDHTGNNAPLHAAGATVLAHENTKSACQRRTICRSITEHRTMRSSTCISILRRWT